MGHKTVNGSIRQLSGGGSGLTIDPELIRIAVAFRPKDMAMNAYDAFERQLIDVVTEPSLSQKQLLRRLSLRCERLANAEKNHAALKKPWQADRADLIEIAALAMRAA